MQPQRYFCLARNAHTLSILCLNSAPALMYVTTVTDDTSIVLERKENAMKEYPPFGLIQNDQYISIIGDTYPLLISQAYVKMAMMPCRPLRSSNSCCLAYQEEIDP